MRKILVSGFLLSLAVSAPLFAQYPACPGPFAKVSGSFQSPQSINVTWQNVPGATMYVVDELRVAVVPESVVTKEIVTQTNSANFTHEAINDVTYSYRIRALGTNAPCEILSQPVKTFGDPVLRTRLRRGIVPIVGSARGANGALFKTSLKLEGAGLKGRIVFHPVNRIARDDDPSIPYDTSVKNEWDDIVAAMGQTGLGSLSIIPAEDDSALLPIATVRLYNVAQGGIFGTSAELYPALDFLNETNPFQRVDVPADGSARANVGARAILDSIAVAVGVSADGRIKKETSRSFAAGEVAFGSPESVYGISLGPGESLLVTFSRGIAPFYTLTDNTTNDPFLYVQGTRRQLVVDQYVK